MEIHKPKPIRNWRDFLKEVGIIVLGVSIALAAEQTVEAVHEHSRAAKTRASIRAEIAFDVGQMEVRKATEACVSKRLDEVDGLIAAAAAGKLPADALWIGRPATYFWSTGQFKSASGSGDAGLLGNQELAGYANVYGAMETYSQNDAGEQKAWADLRALEKHPAPSPALDAMLRGAIQQARSARWAMEAALNNTMIGASKLGIAPAPLERYRMQSACVPLHTPRDQAVKLIAQGRPGKFIYDEP
jgi:hypothetical protein